MVLVLLALLGVKHMFADYFLQTRKMLSARGRYLHGGRALHCGVHVVGSAVVLVPAGVPLGWLALVLAAELLVHYHIDYAKGVWSHRVGHGPNDASYWRAFGVDQTLHWLTYVAMVGVLA